MTDQAATADVPVEPVAPSPTNVAAMLAQLAEGSAPVVPAQPAM